MQEMHLSQKKFKFIKKQKYINLAKMGKILNSLNTITSNFYLYQKQKIKSEKS